MESQRFEKSRGEGVPDALSIPSSEPGASPVQQLIAPGEALLCQYRDARGRGCRMPVSALSNHLADESEPDGSSEGLCTFHTRRLRDRLRAGETTAAELLASVTDFSDASSVNRFLGNLIKLVALKRIPRRDAVTLAYIAQLILNSQAADGRGQLQSLQVQELRRKLAPPPRVMWERPYRGKDPAQDDDSTPAESSGVNRAGTNSGQ